MDPSMDHVVVKTEMQSNGEILLFYVDENGDNEEGVLTTVQNIESEAIEFQQEAHTLNNIDTATGEDGWTDDTINRLLIFYIDNKGPFLSGTTKRDHLWTVACKTMLIGKNPASCEAKLKYLKEKYLEGCWFQKNGINTVIPFQDLCHQAFHDENFQVEFVPDVSNEQANQIKVEKSDENSSVTNKSTADEKVKLMLYLYYKHRKSFQREYPRRDLWDMIAKEIGEDDGVYWQKRFLNYKQHYIRLYDSRKSGVPVKWPYMELFDKIYEDDIEFKKKFGLTQVTTAAEVKHNRSNWNDTEITVLAKYCYDCFDEFLDETIPKNFLWTEIGRLLDKPADMCKLKYNQLKQQHFDKYIDGCYEMRERKPLQIILDNIIYREVGIQLCSDTTLDLRVVDCIDELVQFMYQNIDMFKDNICHFVCWGAVANKLKKDVKSCKRKWDELLVIYKKILEDKKEDPDLQIDWRYIDLFDRIYDYGMDVKLLDGYEILNKRKDNLVGAKKVTIHMPKENQKSSTDIENDYDMDDAKSKHIGDSKAFKILEYYQKNKDKFTSSHRNKHTLWEVLAKQIGISATQCAHRLRNLKQVYTAYVQREINKPEMPILWPYYALCKKVFGYRAIKAKLRNSKHDSDIIEWTAKEIKLLLNYLSENFSSINNSDDLDVWSALVQHIGKSEQACREKFLELRKSYRKLKTKITKNPNVKISWKYFKILDNIYCERESAQGDGNNVDKMEVDQLEEWMNDKSQGDDDYQCIIILPEEGQDASMTSQITSVDMPIDIETNVEKSTQKWTKTLKRQLLVTYIKYIKVHKGNMINAKEMWNEIGEKLNKRPIVCRKMFAKLKSNYVKNKDEKIPYAKLLKRIVKLKPKFEKIGKNIENDTKIYKDVEMADENVLKILQYYLQHVHEFTSPKYDKKCLWHELAFHVSEPVSKVYNKINYLKQVYNNHSTCGIVEFDEILKEITNFVFKTETENLEIYEDTPWSDEEIKTLLEWYLMNLEKFKNPKYIRKYLWMEVSQLLKKSPLCCSKKMNEMREEYKVMVNEKPEELFTWEFYDLCQKIYGTGKKGV